MRFLARLATLALLVPAGAGAAPADPAPRPDPRWDRWQMLLWQDRTPMQMGGLAALGFTGTKLRGTGGEVRPAERALRLATGLPYYLENIATDFYAPYHRYVPDKAINYLIEEARARHRADPADHAAFIREPGLSDPAALDAVRARLTAVVRAEAPNKPLFYNLGDESGIGELAANWDFDLSTASLAGFRAWLPGEYADLAALNAEWGTAYANWDAVQPMLTDAAVQQVDGNFSAWSDFKAWMDVAFARAVRAGTDAVHAGDPTGLAALEGAQVPGWGGYDYTLLAPAVDVMEVYDVGEALDLALAFNPALIPLRTSFATGPRETHAAWRNLLHGGRGQVVWDEADDVVGAQGGAGPRGLELAGLARSIAPVAAALRVATPVIDPVAVLYSPPSFRVRWILDRQAGDRDWAARDAEREYDDNAWRASRRVLTRRLAELGIQPRIIGPATLAARQLGDTTVLLLPHALALSDAEVAAVQAFKAGGGTVLADTEPGLFDGHGRRRSAPPLPDVAHPQAMRPDGDPTTPDMQNGFEALLTAAGIVPRARLMGPDGQRATGVEMRWFQGRDGPGRDGPGRDGLVLSLQAREPWGAPPRVTLRLPGRRSVRSMRTGGEAVVSDRIDVAMDPIEPAVLAITPAP